MTKLKTLKRKAWSLWSRHRRKSAANFRGYVQCFTCDKQIPFTEAHLGHFKHRKLDFDNLNTQVQCSGCNLFHHGRLDVYAVKLVELYGLEAVKDLERRAAKVHKYTKQELTEIIDEISKE